MMNYDMQQVLGVPSSTVNTRLSPHSYYSGSHQTLRPPKTEPFSSSSMSMTSTNLNHPLTKANHPIGNSISASSGRSGDYGNSGLSSEPSLKHPRFDSTVWSNPT